MSVEVEAVFVESVMSRRLPSMNALRAFESSARHLSFSRAAEELFVTQGAISRQIKLLEDSLGVRLFRRLARTIELTEHGREYLPAIRGAFDSIAQATAQLSSGPRYRVLNVSVLPTFAMRWLIPRLSSFALLHPDIEVRLITSIRPVNFAREDIDVAIRVGMPPSERNQCGDKSRISLQMAEDWTDVRCYRLMSDVLVPVCSPALLAAREPVREPRDLLSLPLLHMATRAHAWPDWFHSVGVAYDLANVGPAYGHFFMVLEQALSGAGVAMVPHTLVASDLENGRLVVPVNIQAESAGAYHLLCREREAESSTVAAFRDWLFAGRGGGEKLSGAAPSKAREGLDPFVDASAASEVANDVDEDDWGV